MSARLRQQILSMSREDEQSEELPVVEEGADSLEAEMAEVVAADHDVVESDQAVEDLGEVEASVESLIMSVESALADGGLTPREAELVQHTMDASAHRVGFENRIPSLESFGGESDRERATKVSLEGLKETIARIWQAIKNAINKAIEFVRRYFYKVFAAAPKLMARGRKLRDAAGTYEGGLKEDAKLKVGGMAAELAKFGPTKAAGEVKKLSEGIFGTYGDAGIKYGQEVAAVLKTVKLDSDEDFSKTVTKLIGVKFPIPAGVNKSANASDFGVTGTHKVTVSDALPGGKQLICISPRESSYTGVSGAREYLDKGLAGSRVSMANAKGHQAHEGDWEGAPLSIEEIKQIGSAVSEIGLDMMRYQQKWKGADTVKGEIVKAGDEFSKQTVGEKLSGENKTLAEKLPRLAQAATSSIDSAQRALVGYAATVGQALLAIGEKSLTHHKKKAA